LAAPIPMQRLQFHIGREDVQGYAEVVLQHIVTPMTYETSAPSNTSSRCPKVRAGDNTPVKCQAFPDTSYAVRVLAVPASFACTLAQTNDPLPLHAYSVGAGFTSCLTRLLDIWPSICCLPGSRPLACWLGRPDRLAAISSSLYRILQTEYTHVLSPTSIIPADTPIRCLPCEVPYSNYIRFVPPAEVRLALSAANHSWFVLGAWGGGGVMAVPLTTSRPLSPLPLGTRLC